VIIVFFFYISGIVDHLCLNFLFIIDTTRDKGLSTMVVEFS